MLHLGGMLWGARTFPDFIEPCLPTPGYQAAAEQDWKTRWNLPSGAAVTADARSKIERSRG